MKNIILIVVLLAVSTFALGKDPTSTPDRENVSNEISVQSCRVKLDDKFGGSILMPRTENDFRFAGYIAIITTGGRSREFGFSIGCSDGVANVNDVAAKYGATYDAKKNKWVAYFTDRDREIAGAVTKVYPLHTVNSDGFAVTTDSVTGDMNQRVRFISYCLFHDTKALCGDGQVMKLTDPQGDLLPYALAILRSIEFIDTSGPAPAASSPKP